MKRYPSLLGRLVLWQSLVLAVTLSILSVALIFSVSRRLRAHHDANLIEVVRQATELLEAAEDPTGTGAGALRSRLDALGHNVTLSELPPEAAAQEEGEVRLSMRSEPLEPGLAHRHGASDHVLRVASTTVRKDGHSYLIEASERLGDLGSTLESLRLVILIVAPMVLVLAIAVGALVLERALEPLRQVVQWAGSMEADKLDRRIVIERGPRDINVLVDAFNEMVERLAASFERVQEFTANSSHQLRTPLTSLTSSLEVALLGQRSAEEYRQVLEQSLAEVQQLSRTVELLLLMAQTDTGRIQLRLESIDLETFLMESLEGAHLLGLAAGVSVEVEEMESGVFEGDPSWLRHLFGNLAENAVKYTPAGGSVRVSASLTDGEVRVVVADTGVGIPASERTRIFERYYRAGADTGHPVAGVGLGLPIAAWVAEVHGGRIEVDSEVGVGSRFTVVLPRRAPARDGGPSPRVPG